MIYLDAAYIAKCFLRGDALHLACAEEQGFQEVYTNDRHMLKAARYFHLTGVNVFGENG